MIRISNISLPFTHSEEALWQAVSRLLGVEITSEAGGVVRRRSIDARGHRISFVYTVDVEVADEDALLATPRSGVRLAPSMTYERPASLSTPTARPVIVGAGPAGLFAGLILAEAGLSPLLLERGKDAQSRAKDVASFWQAGTLDAESNALFGEGGAGTFSDGKLTTQIKDKANRCTKVLAELVEAGAPAEIRYLAKPHIGTDILVDVVGNLRQKIVALGGEVRFQTRVDDLIVRDGQACGVVLADGTQIPASAVVLAIGHSARDTFYQLHERGVTFEPKAFSLGARIEHPQNLIDRRQFGSAAGHPLLGAADYALVHHARDGRGVYTFCMCPGGAVMAAASEPGGVVTNGMSTFRRDSENANSALLVSVHPEDFGSDHPLAGIEFQRTWERAAFEQAGGNYFAPAQRVGDFLQGEPSTGPGSIQPTYKPGVTYGSLDTCLPDFVVAAMREAIRAMDRKMRGFAMGDAILTAPETRSSSPVRIPRDKITFQSVNTRNLYPTGEGAGYAGGIISAATDGIKVAEAILQI